jgi:hypothetical protein
MELVLLELTIKETEFLLALLECGSGSRQTALQLLAADHLYEPNLLPKLRNLLKTLRKAEQAKIENVQAEA